MLRTRPSRRLVLSSLAAIMLLAPSQATSTTTGATQAIGNVIPGIGTTSYVVHYSYPSLASVGTNFTVSLSLYLNQFEGEVQYIGKFALELQLFVGPNVLQETINGPVALNATLYPGATWGPENFTFPLTESGTGVAPGTSENATLSVTLQDNVFYYGPGILDVMGMYEETEPPMQASAGSLTIGNHVASLNSDASTGIQSGSGALLPFALLASGIALIVVVLVAFIFRRSGRAFGGS